MTKYITEKTLKSVFPNATTDGFITKRDRLTERHLKLLQDAVALHKVRKDSVRDVSRLEYKEYSVKELHVRGGYGKGYSITISYNRRRPESRLHWISDNQA